MGGGIGAGVPPPTLQQPTPRLARPSVHVCTPWQRRGAPPGTPGGGAPVSESELESFEGYMIAIDRAT